jgi:regulator of Ty1 transposition protein 103
VLTPTTVHHLAILGSFHSKYIQLSEALPKLGSIVYDFMEGHGGNSGNSIIQSL